MAGLPAGARAPRCCGTSGVSSGYFLFLLLSTIRCLLSSVLAGFRVCPHVGRQNELGTHFCLLWHSSGPGFWVAHSNRLAQEPSSVPVGLTLALPWLASLDCVSCLWMAPLGSPVAHSRTPILHLHVGGDNPFPGKAWLWCSSSLLGRGSLDARLV